MFSGSAKHRSHVGGGKHRATRAATGLLGNGYGKQDGRGITTDKIVMILLSIIVIIMLGSLLIVSRNHKSNEKLLNQLGSINNNEMKNLLHGNVGSSGHGRATSSSSSSSSRSAVHNQHDHEQQKVPRSKLVTQSRTSGVKHGPHLPKDGEALHVGSGHGNTLDDKEVARIKKQIKHAARLVDEERHQMQEEKWHAANPKQRERNGDNGQKEEHHYEEQKEKEEEAQKQQTRQVVEEQREEAQQQNDGKTRAADNVQGTAGGATTEVKEVDDFQHPYHPHPDDVERISQQKSSQSGSTTRPASATNEHYKHAHYPTLFEAVEKKRKDLFRKQELIDHGSVVVISSELNQPRLFMYKEFLSDEEITYLVGLTKKKYNTKNEDGDHGNSGTNDTSDGSGLIRQIRAGAADGQAAMQRAQKEHTTVMFPEYDSFVYDIHNSFRESLSANSKVEDDVGLTDLIIGNLVHRVSAWCHIPMTNLESFSVDVFDSATTYQSAYNSSNMETVNDRLATVFIPLTQLDDDAEEEEIKVGDEADYEIEDHDNVIVFPGVKPTYRQLRISKGTFSDGLKTHMRAGNTDDLCNDVDNKLTVNANKGDALLIWSLRSGGTPERKSTYVHCRRMVTRQTAEDAKSPSPSTTKGNRARRYMATINYYAANPRATKSVVGQAPSSSSLRRIYKPADSGCKDESDRCADWAKRGECEKNAAYMSAGCMMSCGYCNDDDR